MTRRGVLTGAACFCAMLGMGTASPAVGETPADLDHYVARALAVFKVPGMAIAIVHDGEVQLARGYGVRRLGHSDPVDAQTLFAIGSQTKAFTAAALAQLVDEGRIAWDDPVIRHLPGFEMYDPYVTREITVRDLLTHRSGLGRGLGDLLFYPGTDYTRDEIVHQIRYLKPVSSFRSKYAYDNLLYLVAGQLIPAVTDTSWDDFVRERIFVPLGMTSSATTVASLRSGADVAAPHAVVGDSLRAITPMDLDNIGPAGSIVSNAADMAKWLIVQLGAGSLAGVQPGSQARLFSAARSREMWSAQTSVPFADPPPELAALRTNFAAYGLGWNLREYRGRRILTHAGGLQGFVSQVTLVPELGLGVVVLTNQEQGSAVAVVMDHILDAAMGGERPDWIAKFDALLRAQRSADSSSAAGAPAQRIPDSKPSLALERYAGRYRDAWRGDATLGLEDAHLVLRISHAAALVGDLEHWQDDTFIVRWRDRALHADAYVTFALGPGGNVESMRLAAVSPDTDSSYDFRDLLFTPVAAPPGSAH